MATKTLRVPMSIAAKKGVSWLPVAADRSRVVLTSHDRPVAVVDSAKRLDEDVRKMREAAWSVLEWAAKQTSERCIKFNLDEVCENLGLSADEVRERSLNAATPSIP